jgi:ZIP family zinc transporter
MDALLGISSGIMFASAIFSLLLPAIEQANNVLIIPTSILLGTLILIILNKIIDKKIVKCNNDNNIFLLIISIVLHNIPEGLAIGCAFASAAIMDSVNIAAAISLTIGIGIQNFPEGAAVSIPLRRLNFSRIKCFIIGSLSGIVEVFASIIGALLVMKINNILPILLAFAAGAMLFVVIEELIPESQENKKYKTLIAYLTLIGFVFMMLLEI